MNQDKSNQVMRQVCQEIQTAVKFNLKNFTEDLCSLYEFPSSSSSMHIMLNQFYSFCSGYCKWEYISRSTN